MGRVCSIEGCGKRHYGRGWCSTHYQLWRHNGGPTARLGTPRGDAARYLSDVVFSYEGDDCLFWPYAKSGGKKATINRGGRMLTIARVVCEKVNGPPPTPKHESAHSCGNGHLGCVTQGHLSWKTSVENAADKIGHGTAPRGERNPNAKLSDADAVAIRASEARTSDLVAEYGVVRQVIINIRSGRSWRHL